MITLPLGVNVGGQGVGAFAADASSPRTCSGCSTAARRRSAFRFTPTGLGAKWRIDDVYVDPMARH